MSEECPNCRQLTNSSFSRLVKDSCGHTKCRMCLLYEEHGCKACNDDHSIQNLDTFGYISPINEAQDNIYVSAQNPIVPEETILPLELVINKDTRSKDLDFISVNNIQNEAFDKREIVAIDNEKSNTGKSEANGRSNNVTSTLHIPKMEPCEMVSNICAQLTESNNITFNFEATCTITATPTTVEPASSVSIILLSNMKSHMKSLCSFLPLGNVMPVYWATLIRLFQTNVHLKGKNASKTCRKICKVYGENAVSERWTQEWFAGFCCGNFDVKDAPRSGRPVTEKLDEMAKLPEKQQKETKSEETEKEVLLASKQLKHPDRTHISVIPGDPEKYKCNVCKKIFRNKKGKCYHDACVTGIKPYKCNICDRSFVKRSHFEYHERVHSGYRPFKCNLCDKAFPQQNKLNRHMYSHSKEKQFVCSKCDKRYNKRDDLRNHLAIHNDTKPHTCKICKKSYHIQAALTRHMRTHSNERPHMCEQCNKTFKDSSLLGRHKRTHGKERPFSCVHCSRVFLSKSELMRHMTVHSDEKPFSCEYCQTVFRRKDNLNRHIRHHHVEDLNYESNKAQIVVPEVNKKVAKTPSMNNQKRKQKSKRSTKNLNLLPNSPAKVPGIYVNSNEQINSRLDSMGNITPVIRNTSELSNAVPVINGPISVKKANKTVPRKKTFTYTEPIPRAEAVVINRRIEEKLYPQSSYFFRNCSTHIGNLPSTGITQSIRTNYSVKNSPPIKSISLENSSSDFTASRSTFTHQNIESPVQDTKQNDVTDKLQVYSKSTAIGEKFSELCALNEDSMTESIVNVTETNSNGHVNSTEINLLGSSIREEKTNCVSTIKKHTLHQSGLTKSEETSIVNKSTDRPAKSALLKCSETVNENQSNVHWRRRTAEIFKELGQ